MYKKMIKILDKILPDFLTSRLKYSKFLKNNCVIGSNVEILDSSIGKNVRFAIQASVRNCKIDDYTSIGRYSKINSSSLGKFCSISWDVTIGATNHPTGMITTHSFPYIKRIGFVKDDKRVLSETKLGNDVWVGCNSVIIPGVSIGNGAVIGAGSVVTKDVPSYAIVAGVPARIVKYRFDKHIIEKLNEIEWWDFPNSIIKENIELFQKSLDEVTIQKMLNLKNDISS